MSLSVEGTAVLCAGVVVTAAGTAIGLRLMDYERVPRVAMLSAAFFVASLVHITIGPASVHLVLTGLAGVILGWAAFPALLVALFLQAILFAYGGLTTLGINTMTMALPAVTCYYLFGHAIRARHDRVALGAGFAAGLAAVVLGAMLTAGALMAVGDEFKMVCQTVVLAHLPVAVIEGLVTGSVVLFLRRVRPELLRIPLLAPRTLEVSHA